MESGNRRQPPVFTGYRLAECAVCLAVILFGVLYLKTDLLSLWVLLPVFLAAFIAIPVLRYLDEKKRGIRGLALGFSVGIAMLPALVVLAAILVYFL
ncbi:MAG: hypothetical protein IKY52_13055 [Clostridia bacterium]|nr:hypothetical protein [Clostridia bacterium]